MLIGQIGQHLAGLRARSGKTVLPVDDERSAF
jgi:hypothetical protein